MVMTSHGQARYKHNYYYPSSLVISLPEIARCVRKHYRGIYDVMKILYLYTLASNSEAHDL